MIVQVDADATDTLKALIAARRALDKTRHAAALDRLIDAVLVYQGEEGVREGAVRDARILAEELERRAADDAQTVIGVPADEKYRTQLTIDADAALRIGVAGYCKLHGGKSTGPRTAVGIERRPLLAQDTRRVLAG